MPDEQKDPRDQEIIDLKAKVATAEKAVVDKQTELTGATGVIGELKAKVATLEKASAEKDKQLQDAGKVVTELKTKLADVPVEVKADSHGQVKSGKDTYELTVPSFNHLGDIITLDVLKERPKLVDSLVADRVGFLRKVA